MHKSGISFSLGPGEKVFFPNLQWHQPLQNAPSGYHVTKTPHWHHVVIWNSWIQDLFLTVPPWKSTVSYMRKASVAMTPHVWKAWWKSASSGYFTAASMMIHHPVKNCINHKHQHARQMWTELKQEALHPVRATTTEVNPDIKQKADTSYFCSHFLSVNKTQMPEQYQDSGSHRCDGVPSLPPVHAALTVSTSDPVQKSWHDCGRKCVRAKLQAVFQLRHSSTTQ